MPEFLRTAKVTYEFAGRDYIVSVNEYGVADVSCYFGRGIEWSVKVRPGKTLSETLTPNGAQTPSESWIARLEAAIADLRGLVEA